MRRNRPLNFWATLLARPWVPMWSCHTASLRRYILLKCNGSDPPTRGEVLATADLQSPLAACRCSINCARRQQGMLALHLRRRKHRGREGHARGYTPLSETSRRQADGGGRALDGGGGMIEEMPAAAELEPAFHDCTGGESMLAVGRCAVRVAAWLRRQQRRLAPSSTCPLP